MPSPPVRKSFIAKGLTGGTLVLVKYLAQIGNKKGKIWEGNEFVPSAHILSWPSQEGRSTARTPERNTTTPGGNRLGSWCCWKRGRALWSRCTASCGLARLRRAATGLFLWFSPPQANGGAGAYINQPQILVGDLLCPHDVRCDRKNDFGFAPSVILLTKQVLQEGNFCQPRITANRVCFFIRQNTAHQVNLTVFQSRFVLDAALPDCGLIYSTDILRTRDR